MLVPSSRNTTHNRKPQSFKNNIIVFQKFKDRVRLLSVKDRGPYLRVKNITGIMPRDINLYRTALKHKSLSRGEKGERRVNNERLEYLGDAVLGAVVADILYKRYPTRQEGFLTTLRSKIVRRDTLNQLAVQLGLDKLVLHDGPVTSAHNSYMNGNAFEAFIGALYLDRGYRACCKFIDKVVFSRHINIEEMSQKEVNYKSKLIEWCQKYQLAHQFDIVSQKILADRTTPIFVSRLTIEGIYVGRGEGYSKKESHQQAARQGYQKVRRDVNLVNRLIEARNERLRNAKKQ